MIYFIQDTTTHAIKIGHALDDFEMRRRQLQTGNPSVLVILWTCPGDEEAEHRLHRQFASDRIAGEWFKPSHSLLLWLLDSAQMHGRHTAMADMEAACTSRS